MTNTFLTGTVMHVTLTARVMKDKKQSLLIISWRSNGLKGYKGNLGNRLSADMQSRLHGLCLFRGLHSLPVNRWKSLTNYCQVRKIAYKLSFRTAIYCLHLSCFFLQPMSGVGLLTWDVQLGEFWLNATNITSTGGTHLFYYLRSFSA